MWLLFISFGLVFLKVLACQSRQGVVIAVNQRFTYCPSLALHLFLSFVGLGNSWKLGSEYELHWPTPGCVFAASTLVVFPKTTLQVPG